MNYGEKLEPGELVFIINCAWQNGEDGIDWSIVTDTIAKPFSGNDLYVHVKGSKDHVIRWRLFRTQEEAQAATREHAAIRKAQAEQEILSAQGEINMLGGIIESGAPCDTKPRPAADERVHFREEAEARIEDLEAEVARMRSEMGVRR